MPAYNFQEQFVPLILNGQKPHTIRRKRKNPTKPGDRLVLYTGMRTKSCKKIMETQCTSIVPIKIYPGSGQIILDGRLLPLNEVLHFAVRDGFANHMDFFKFFECYPAQVRENELEVIYWR